MKDRDYWIGVDLDGTIAEHYWPSKGPYDALRIGDPIKPMVQRVKDWLYDGKTVKIFTARVAPRQYNIGREYPLLEIKQAIGLWCRTHVGAYLEATCTKDYMMTALFDDRAVQIVHNQGVPCCDRFQI